MIHISLLSHLSFNSQSLELVYSLISPLLVIRAFNLKHSGIIKDTSCIYRSTIFTFVDLKIINIFTSNTTSTLYTSRNHYIFEIINFHTTWYNLMPRPLIPYFTSTFKYLSSLIKKFSSVKSSCILFYLLTYLIGCQYDLLYKLGHFYRMKRVLSIIKPGKVCTKSHSISFKTPASTLNCLALWLASMTNRRLSTISAQIIKKVVLNVSQLFYSPSNSFQNYQEFKYQKRFMSQIILKEF